jgi:hypothetical protein
MTSFGAFNVVFADLDATLAPVTEVPDAPGVLPTTAATPAWRRVTEGESRLPVLVAIAVDLVLQLVLPDRLAAKPHWLLPAIAFALIAGLSVFNPLRMNRAHPLARAGGLGLTALLTAANCVSAGLLIDAILTGDGTDDPTRLLGSGAAIYLTNIVAFALWFWEIDRDGPVARAGARNLRPDFLFPQLSTPELADADWEPNFFDYLYVSFTNATAFSPTDTLPISRRAKGLMALQSAIALAVVGLVVARAVNILR